MRSDADGHPLIDGSSGYKIISNNDGTPMQEITSPVTSIARKVIVYSNPQRPQEYVVVNFQ